jgi:hypothetical protein
MKPLTIDALPYCSLLCDEIRNYEGRRVCRLTDQAVTTKLTETGVLCRPAVSAITNALAQWETAADNPGCTLLRTVAARARDANA